MRLIAAILSCCLALPGIAQFSKPRRAYVEYLVTVDRPTRTCHVGEHPVIRVEAYKGGLPVDGVTLHYKTGDEMMDMHADSTLFSGGMAEIPLGTREKPGFRVCNLNFEIYGKTYKDIVKVGYDPEKIEPLTPDPNDFDRFWGEALRRVANVDLAPEITPLPQYSTDSVEVSLVKLTVGPDGRNMYGYLTKPKGDGKYPVLFCPPGAGANKIPYTTYYSDNGFIYLDVNIHSGCNPELPDSIYEEVRKIADDYNRVGIAQKDSFYYKDVYAGCSRCVDFLCTLPEWDGLNVGVTGGSQGGALSIVTAALNPKITFCSPFYPALCDVLGFKHGRAGGWPKYYRETEEDAGAEATLPYYDVVNFARRLKCPVFYSFGYNDETCSPTSTMAAYNVITSEKILRVTPTSGHWRFPDTNDESVEWMKSLCQRR